MNPADWEYLADFWTERANRYARRANFQTLLSACFIFPAHNAAAAKENQRRADYYQREAATCRRFAEEDRQAGK
ncbi:hypothetical protein ACUH93_07135 [Dermabacteraceae bacterium P7006]